MSFVTLRWYIGVADEEHKFDLTIKKNVTKANLEVKIFFR